MSVNEVLKHATNPTDQWGAPPPSKTTLQHEDGCGSGAAVPSLQETSVSLCSRSSKGRTGAAGPGAQSSLHSQDPLKLGSCFKRDGKVDGGILKRFSNACPGGFSAKKRRAWLRGLAPSRSSCFTASIAWRPRNSLRSIGFWFLRGFIPRRAAKRV